MRKTTSALFFIIFLLISSAKADSNDFAFSTITFAGSSNTVAYGVNNAGQIVGAENANNGQLNGFLSTGAYTTFNAPGALAGSYAEGINNRGQIVGSNLSSAGFLLDAGNFTPIVFPGSDPGTTNATGINDSGQIVGTFLRNGVGSGFVLSGGIYTPISYPGAATTFAWGINDSGQIVGWYTNNGGTFGFLFSVGNYTQIAFPGATSTKAFGINNAGQIVGQYSSFGMMSGFVAEGGNYFSVNAPGSSSTSVNGINDAGQIVGSFLSGQTTLGFSAAQTVESISLNLFPVASGAGPITAGPDGAMWFAGGTVIGRITTAGVITTFPLPKSTYITGIAAGSDGAVWFNESTNGRIGRITTSGEVTEYPLPFQNMATGGIAAGSDGALWFTEETYGVGGGIGRISTAGVITEYLLPNPAANPIGIAAGPDGALWFTETVGNAIGRITTSGLAITEYPVLTPNSQPYGIALGPDGALWFTEPSAGNIGRVTTAGTITEYSAPAANSQPAAIAAGPDGALWYSDSNNLTVGRITTSGVFTTYPDALGGGSIAAGPDGAIWFADATYIGHIVPVPNPSLPPTLSITKTHSGNFTQSQTNAIYTVVVSNQTGVSETSGVVTVTDTLPAGLTLVSMAGGGWSCSSNSCSRNDPLPGGASYPPITVKVNVISGAGPTQVNSVSVTGGGSAVAIATDATTVIPNPPLLRITKTHMGNFGQGQPNVVYTVTVMNQAGPTNGTVTVAEMLPGGLSLVSMAGTGWNCAGVTCSRSDPLTNGSSYPAITVTVNVANNASSPQVNMVSVTGGGTATVTTISDSTVIVPAGQGTLTASPVGGSTFTFALGAMPAYLGATPYNISLDIATNPIGLDFTVTPSANLTSNVTAGKTPSVPQITVNTATVTTPGSESGSVTVSVPSSELGCASPVMVAGQSMCTVTVPFTINVQPIFLQGGDPLGGGFFSLPWFGTYTYVSYNPLTVYNTTLGFEGVFTTTDANHGIYLFDDSSSHIWYTNPSLFPYFFDFTANSWLYYFGGNATKGGRSFYNFGGVSAAAGYTTPGFIFL